MKRSSLILIILDGWGINPRQEGNAIALASTPTWDFITKAYPSTQLEASGLAVGLRQGLMGNSEVGHLNIGAGRVVWQEITRIDNAIQDGSFFKLRPFLDAIENIKVTGGCLHLLGLVSEGGIHTSESHYLALIDLARRNNLPRDRVLFHAFMDGRDTPPTSGIEFMRNLVSKMQQAGVGRVATIAGRYWAMDRDKRWDRVKRAYEAMVMGSGRVAVDPVQAIQQAYDSGETDEFIQPTVITDPQTGLPVGRIRSGDSMIFFNFRTDRTRELTRAFTEKGFSEFHREVVVDVYFATMTRYHEQFTLPVAFEPIRLQNILGEILSLNRCRQLRIAETEKYAHVTFFLNGGIDTPFPGEERILVPSPKVATYDLKPEMSAYEVTDRVIEAIEPGGFDLVVLNYANPDMVGHTGVLDAAIKAAEAVDTCTGRVLQKVRQKGWVAIVTSDHGNCEQMIDYNTGQPQTYHTTSPVAFVLVSDQHKGVRLRQGGLKDISPTILNLMGIDVPPEMEGSSLILS